jgi:tetrahydromethanopterin S-methyltransferase subunit D
MKTPPKILLILVVILPTLAFGLLSYLSLKGIDYIPVKQEDRSVLRTAKGIGQGAAGLAAVSGLMLGLGLALVGPSIWGKRNSVGEPKQCSS